ncbi:MAG: response regulator [Symplocastrum torsivum CPER-KK1]|jgi:CheY-like chemotaxis protein|uniref:Response regulator n=1 Tax=Symplocastrum torsivum CPER-KK1 TaxID=450513 RepID=A0A951PIZ8_9CYAN|nr:response regulator [Symplocastrum torsivum CPER-KK1]
MPRAVILCVDDEAVILKSLEIELQSAFGDTYLYEFAESGDEALEIIDELTGEEVQLLIIVSDWLMPGMKGDELLIKVHQNYPKIHKVMLTGQADDQAVDRAKQYANLYRYLQKPWNSQELIETIRSALA